MEKLIHVNNGVLRSQPVSGKFRMVSEFRTGKDGQFIKVHLDNGQFARLYCNPSEVSVLSGADDEAVGQPLNHSIPTAIDFESVVRAAETPEQAARRIEKSFAIIETMTAGLIDSTIRAFIVSGPPGIGKSHTIERMVTSEVDEKDYTIVKGMTTPICLFQLLYSMRRRGQIVIFDDCDNVFKDEVSLNILKAVLDSSPQRFVSWNSESRILKEADIPNTFEFCGGVVFLTNLNFDRSKNQLKDHLEALKSRCFYIDLGISNRADMLVRIKTLINRGMLEEYDFSEAEQNDIVGFIEANVDQLQEVSLRTVVKAASLRKRMGPDWREIATVTLLTNQARWKSLFEQNQF